MPNHLRLRAGKRWEWQWRRMQILLQINVTLPNLALNLPAREINSCGRCPEFWWDSKQIHSILPNPLSKKKSSLSSLITEISNAKTRVAKTDFPGRKMRGLIKLCSLIVVSEGLFESRRRFGEFTVGYLLFLRGKDRNGKVWGCGEKGIMIRQWERERGREGDPTCQHLLSIRMPQWGNYKLASSGINPADSTLGLAIWQETFWPQSGACVEIADAGGEGCKERETWSESSKEEEVRRGGAVIVPGIGSQGVCKRLTAGICS